MPKSKVPCPRCGNPMKYGCQTCWPCYQEIHREATLQRFLSKIDVVQGPLETACWVWTGQVMSNGYGNFWAYGRKRRAHRFSYQTFKGAIPTGLEPDHLCRNRACVNSEHLELVTRSENNRRGLLGVLRKEVQTHCKRGHPFDEANTSVDAKGHRTCRICRNEHAARWNRRHKEYCAKKRMEYYYRNLEKCRAAAREYQRKKKERRENQ